MDKKEIRDAKEEAARIIREAEEAARQIYGASLEYVDDMLSEVNLLVLRNKELMRQQMNQTLEEFDAKLELMSSHKMELLELLREHTKDGTQPIQKGQYEIKVNEAYFPKEPSHVPPQQEIYAKPKPEPEPEERVVGRFTAEDFDLDAEYFEWLREREERGE